MKKRIVVTYPFSIIVFWREFMAKNYEEYMLFLDESCIGNFCAIGGVIIKRSECINLESKIKELKKILWEEDFFDKNQDNCILHATDLNALKINYNNKNYKVSSKPNLKEIKSENIISFYNKLTQFIRENNIIPIFSIIDETLFKSYYGFEGLKKLDLQLFCFENIMQTYTHFLEKSDGIGFVTYEAQNGDSNLDSSPDHKIINHFFEIKINNKGMWGFTSNMSKNRLRNINIIKKKENNNLLQLADLILFAYLKGLHQNKIFKDELTKEIHTKLYNGNLDPRILDIREYWGVRIFPNDISRLKKLEDQLKKLKNSLVNLKNSLKKEEKKNKKILGESKKLKEENKKVIEELERLKKENQALKEEKNN